MAKQACSAYLLCEGHDLDTVTQHLMYLFLDFILLIVVFCVVMAQAEKTLINDANKGYIHLEDVVVLCVCRGKKILLIFLNKFKLVIFCFIAVFSFSFYI